MSISNRIENTIIAVSTVILTVVIMNFAVIKPMRNDFDRKFQKQHSLIKELAMLEKYQIENNYDKIKSHKGQIVLDLNNNMNVANSDSTFVVEQDTTEDKGFFERLFGKKD